MLKKYINYCKGTLLSRFSKSFTLKRSSFKWVNYRITSKNKVEVVDSRVCKSSFRINGVNNRIIIKEGANVVYTSISIIGNGNEVVLDGCEAMLSILIRGNNCKVSVGKRSLLDESSTLIVMGQNNSIEIGEECMFAEHVEIWASDTHLITDLDGNAINPSKPVKIGNHVWLGKHVCVMKGVSIGDHSVVGLGSIVSKDIPSHSIAVGNPAKVVKNGVDWKFGFIEI